MGIISKSTRWIYKVINYYKLKKNKVLFGNGLKINGILKFYGDKGRVSFGNNVTINSGKNVIPIGFGIGCSFWTFQEGEIRIGNSCGLTNVSICSANCVEIGDHVLMGGGVKIYDTDFHSLDYQTRRDLVNDNDRKSRPVKIGDDVFLGAGTIVLKGTVIGERSIIGAGSVVCGNIPAEQIWAGNPAKFIKNIE